MAGNGTDIDDAPASHLAHARQYSFNAAHGSEVVSVHCVGKTPVWAILR